MNSKASHISRIAFISALVALGVSLSLIEELIPRPFPFLKLGFGNIVNVIALYSLGLRQTFVIGILRVMVASILAGKFLTPGFVLSLAACVSSILAMKVILFAGKNFFSPLGVSVFGAFTHNITQLAVASSIILHNRGILFLIPYFSLIAIFTGGITGYLVLLITPMMSSVFQKIGGEKLSFY